MKILLKMATVATSFLLPFSVFGKDSCASVSDLTGITGPRVVHGLELLSMTTTGQVNIRFGGEEGKLAASSTRIGESLSLVLERDQNSLKDPVKGIAESGNVVILGRAGPGSKVPYIPNWFKELIRKVSDNPAVSRGHISIVQLSDGRALVFSGTPAIEGGKPYIRYATHVAMVGYQLDDGRAVRLFEPDLGILIPIGGSIKLWFAGRTEPVEVKAIGLPDAPSSN